MARLLPENFSPEELNIEIEEHDKQVIWGTKFIRFWEEVFCCQSLVVGYGLLELCV